LIPLTINEIHRLFNRIAAPIQHTVAHTLHWSCWRGTSQHAPVPATTTDEATNCHCSTRRLPLKHLGAGTPSPSTSRRP
jgi:hypothetical protein